MQRQDTIPSGKTLLSAMIGASISLFDDLHKCLNSSAHVSILFIEMDSKNNVKSGRRFVAYGSVFVFGFPSFLHWPYRLEGEDVG
jgi:hypothetical protein